MEFLGCASNNWNEGKVINYKRTLCTLGHRPKSIPGRSGIRIDLCWDICRPEIEKKTVIAKKIIISQKEP